MELTEELRYRLSYLTLRLAFDRRLTTAASPADCMGILKFLDLLSGTNLVDEYASKGPGARFMSQQEKIEGFVDAEFDETVLEVVRQAVRDLVA
jgi:hypothetical protein